MSTKLVYVGEVLLVNFVKLKFWSANKIRASMVCVWTCWVRIFVNVITAIPVRIVTNWKFLDNPKEYPIPVTNVLETKRAFQFLNSVNPYGSVLKIGMVLTAILIVLLKIRVKKVIIHAIPRRVLKSAMADG